MITRQLVSIGSLSSLLQVDATFKVNWNELSLLVFGSSDSNRHFHPYGVALISTDEAADSYMHVFQTLKQVVQSVTGIVFNVAYLLGDGAKGITAAQQHEFPTAKRLMCWAHTLRKCREHRKMLAFGDGVFDIGIKLLLKKWKDDSDLHVFAKYFEEQWVNTLKFWYEGVGFRTFPNIDASSEAAAWKWLRDLDKNSLLPCYINSIVIPSSYPSKMNAATWLQQYSLMPWSTFHDFSIWLFSGRLVTVPLICNCKPNLKTYVCKHALGIMMHFGYYHVTDPSKLENFARKRGRPKKARLALFK
ncbi:unnamed protein product [Didymodactylos carnosus]|uniref:SWIM-type domain-containing protein n=1 Tax=Didymodactylos carnosus TaxID=1234261 RepID=A0A8S2DYD1_9BILA|nr:unnamed protein product [Didymodactylos carnosus]CAF3797752.1 unnamed protein product [Didymodactylos carnosus]